MGFSTKSLLFDGVNEYITLGNVLGFEYTSPRSFSWWARWTEATTYHYFFSKMLGTTTWQGFEIYTNSTGVIAFAMSNNAGTGNQIHVSSTASGFNDGNWHHFVLTWDGNASPGAAGVTLYVDGSPSALTVTLDALSATILNSDPFVIGARRLTSDYCFNGKMDEIAIYDKELTADEVSWIYNGMEPPDLSLTAAPSGLVAWWRMGEWAGLSPVVILDSGPSAVPAIVRDLSGNNYTGTMTAMEATDVVYDAPGRGHSLYYNGSVSTSTASTPAFDRNTPFSISAWVKFPGSGGTVISRVTGQQGWWLDASSTGVSLTLNVTWATNTIYVSAGGFTIPADTWFHVVATFDGSGVGAGVQLYVNGVQLTPSVGVDNLVSSIIYSSGDQVVIGYRPVSYTTCSVDEVSLWSRVLTPSEVTTIYNGGVPNDVGTLDAQYLHAYFHMGDGDIWNTMFDYGSNPQQAAWVYTQNMCQATGSGQLYNMAPENIVYDAPGHGKSVMFEGTNEYAVVGNVLGFERTDPFSISFWFRTTSLAYQHIVCKRPASGNYEGYSVSMSGTGYFDCILQNSSGNAVHVRTPAGFNDGHWHHLVFTYSGGSTAHSCHVLIDGISKTLSVIADTLSASILTTASLVLGAIQTSQPYTGRLNNVAIYSKELSVSEAQWLYGSGSPPHLYASGSPSNLEAWWKCGEGDKHPRLVDSGPNAVPNTVKDASGNGYDGTMTNMETSDVFYDAPGVPLSTWFEGGNEYVDMGDVLGFERTDPFSLSTWFRTTDTGDQFAVSKMGPSTAYQGWGWGKWTGGIYFILRNDNVSGNKILVYIPTTYLDGKWHHIVWTYAGDSNAANIHCYVDGSEVTPTIDTNNLTATIQTSSTMRIGSRDGGSYFVGTLNNAAIYDKVLSLTEAQWIYNSGTPRPLDDGGAPSNLVGWWKMGEGDTFPTLTDSATPNPWPYIPDSSGNGYEATASNLSFSAIVADSPGGSFSTKCLAFTGSPTRLVAGTNFAFERTDPFSFSFWVKSSTGGANATFLSRIVDGSPYTGYEVCVYSSELAVWLANNWGANYIRCSFGAPPTDGAWHHVVVTFDGSSSASGLNVIVDGALRTRNIIADNLTATMVSASTEFQIAGAEYDLTGRMDEVAVYDKELSLSEAQWIYNSGVPRSLQDSGAPTGLLAWWMMGEGVSVPLNGIATNMEASDFVGDSPGYWVFYMRSLQFGGTNEYVTAGNVLDFDTTDPFSVAFWIKVTTPDTYYVISKIQISGPRGWTCYVTATGGIVFNIANANPGPYISVGVGGTTVEDGSWHHIVLTWDGNATPGAAGASIYFDGVAQSLGIYSDTLGSGTISNTGSFVLGSVTWVSLPLIGNLDEVGVYAKELTPTEVAWIYNSGVPRDLVASAAPTKLAAYWRLGENAYAATMTNMEAYDVVADAPDDPPNFAVKSYTFDGVNEYVSMGNILAYERTSPFTISFWFKSSSRIVQYLISKRSTTSPYPGYAVCLLATGEIWFYLGNNNSTNYIGVNTTSKDWHDGEWHHVVASYSGTSLASGVVIYVDGVAQTPNVVSDTLSATVVTTDSFILGSFNGTGNYLIGNIDEVAVYSRALTADEVTWIYNGGVPRYLKGPGAPLTLTSWWRIGEGWSCSTGSGWVDMRGDSPGLVSDFAKRCLWFDGFGEYVDMGNVLAFERTQPFSISCWARWISDDYGALVAKEDGSYVGYMVYKYPGGGLAFEITQAGGTSMGQYSTVWGLGNGAWHHIVATYDGSSTKAGMRVYLNGTLVGSGGTGTLTASIVTTAALRIGQRTADLPLTGNVDETSIYAKELSAAEVEWIYNSGIPRDLHDVAAPSDLSGWWRLGEGAYSAVTVNMEAGDIVSDAPTNEVTPSETVTLSEGLAVDHAAFLSIPSEVVLIEETLVSEGEDRDIAETIVVSENALIIRGAEPVAIPESVALSESSEAQETVNFLPDETVPLSEHVDIFHPFVRIAETVPLSASVVASIPEVEPLLEVVPLEEALEVFRGDEIQLEVVNKTPSAIALEGKLPLELGHSPRNDVVCIPSLSFVAVDGGVPIQVEQITKDYDVYHTGATGFLRYQEPVEDPRTRQNLFEHSEDLDNSYWVRVNGWWVADSLDAPPGYGGQIADEFFEDTTSGDHRAIQLDLDQPGTGYTRYTLSVFAKKSNRRWLYFMIEEGHSLKRVYIDLETGTVGSSSFTGAYDPEYGIQSVGGGWYRCWISMTLVNGITRRYIVGCASADGGWSYTGLDQSAMYFFGAQLSQTDEITPYLKSGESYVPYAEFQIPRILRDEDFAAFASNYLEIVTGTNQGIYQIRRVLAQNIEGNQPVVLQLDRELSTMGTSDGYVQGNLTWISTTIESGEVVNRFSLDHPLVTAEDPLVEVVYWYRKDGNHYTVQGFYVDPAEPNIVKNSYTPNGNWDAAEATVFAIARVSPKTEWRVISGIKRFLIETTKPTVGKSYEMSAKSLHTKDGQLVDLVGYLLISLEDVQLPRAIGVSLLGDEGTVLVEYDQPMQADAGALFNPADYSITGPTDVTIHQVYAYTPTTVALKTAGLGEGDYTLTISTGTPKDLAGNPVDPLWNSVVFTSSAPLTFRSIFTDKGPIAKPPLTLQSGTGAVLESFTDVTLPGASLTSSHIGKYVTLGGGALNGGTFRLSSVVSTTRAKLQASFTLPDPDSGSLDWELFDPQNGLIADDPSDVSVRINGSPVTPEAVIGLLGQIVLNAAPAPADDVKVDYSWCCNPTLDFRRLNSREFRLNAWNRDQGYPNDLSQHKYRYNNVLVVPSEYEPLDPRATLDQPEEREMHYRAYERAYTPVLNDPTLLLLNSPTHHIAYPPAQRTVYEEFVGYEGIGLPESQIVNPWTRKGSGTATASSGVLTVIDDSSGPYPTGKPIFWDRVVDMTFPLVFAMSWRFVLDVVAEFDGVFSGVVAGYSEELVAGIVGFLEEAGVKKVGFLKRGYGDDPSTASSWTGGLDSSGNPTYVAAEFDWSTLHSYRLLRDQNGTVKLFVDGEFDPLLQVLSSELPFLTELASPFDAIEDVFFGSISRPARSTSSWDFIRYLVQPTNPLQTSPSSFVSYEANVIPEVDPKPWTPVGYHGTETILSTDFLLLDSTSASDVTDVGYVGGDYRGFLRFEPLLTQASEFVVDANLQLRTHTHGIADDGLMFVVDDSSRFIQVCFFPDKAAPKISYGGRSLPEDFTPYAWSSMGTQTAAMAGRVLRITDSLVGDGLIYYYDDIQPATSDDRVIASTIDYMLEFRCQVVSYTVDGSGFAGAFGQVFDGTRSVGLLLRESGGTKYVAFESDGVMLTGFAFDWGDGEAHTYRLTKSTSGNLVSLFVDGTYLGALAYSSFPAPAPATTGQVSFGSSTPASAGAVSVVDWHYCNAWRVLSSLRRFVGIYKGSDSDSLLGYHLPLKASGRGATAVGNALGDANADFLAALVTSGDFLVVDDGPNRGVYDVQSVAAQNLTLTTVWPQQPSLVDYRIVKEVDWSAYHQYRLTRDSTGEIALLLDADTEPLIRLDYGAIDLPSSGSGFIRVLSGGLPAVAFGSFSVENLAQSSWDYVRYGITRSPTELRIVPHHEVLNQWNVMQSPERLYTLLPHDLTDFKSSSTGVVPKTDPDFLADSALLAYTQLNDSTPIVPQTQTFEVRAPYPTQEFVSALNRPEDILNSDADFTLNDSTIRYRLIVPDNVLYSSLDIIEQSSGEESLLTPFCDGCQPTITGLDYTQRVCLDYEGDVLPEQDTTAPTPWTLLSDNPGQVSASAFGSILTYGTGAGGTKTVYRNDTPLPDAPGLRTEARFRFKVLADSTLGTGDSQIRVGLSAPGLTVGLAFVTTVLAERLVYVVDLNNGQALGSATFDFLDGNYHTYRIVRDPGRGVVQIFIDS